MLLRQKTTVTTCRRHRLKSHALIVKACTTLQLCKEPVEVALQIERQVAFGEALRIVGNTAELGQWDASRGIDLKWSPGHVWLANLALNPGQYEFKVVRVFGADVEWEYGSNRHLDVPYDAKSINVCCSLDSSVPLSVEYVSDPIADDLKLLQNRYSETQESITSHTPNSLSNITTTSYGRIGDESSLFEQERRAKSISEGAMPSAGFNVEVSLLPSVQAVNSSNGTLDSSVSNSRDAIYSLVTDQSNQDSQNAVAVTDTRQETSPSQNVHMHDEPIDSIEMQPASGAVASALHTSNGVSFDAGDSRDEASISNLAEPASEQIQVLPYSKELKALGDPTIEAAAKLAIYSAGAAPTSSANAGSVTSNGNGIRGFQGWDIGQQFALETSSFTVSPVYSWEALIQSESTIQMLVDDINAWQKISFLERNQPELKSKENSPVNLEDGSGTADVPDAVPLKKEVGAAAEHKDQAMAAAAAIAVAVPPPEPGLVKLKGVDNALDVPSSSSGMSAASAVDSASNTLQPDSGQSELGGADNATTISPYSNGTSDDLRGLKSASSADLSTSGVSADEEQTVSSLITTKSTADNQPSSFGSLESTERMVEEDAGHKTNRDGSDLLNTSGASNAVLIFSTASTGSATEGLNMNGNGVAIGPPPENNIEEGPREMIDSEVQEPFKAMVYSNGANPKPASLLLSAAVATETSLAAGEAAEATGTLAAGAAATAAGVEPEVAATATSPAPGTAAAAVLTAAASATVAEGLAPEVAALALAPIARAVLAAAALAAARSAPAATESAAATIEAGITAGAVAPAIRQTGTAAEAAISTADSEAAALQNIIQTGTAAEAATSTAKFEAATSTAKFEGAALSERAAASQLPTLMEPVTSTAESVAAEVLPIAAARPAMTAPLAPASTVDPVTVQNLQTASVALTPAATLPLQLAAGEDSPTAGTAAAAAATPTSRAVTSSAKGASIAELLIQANDELIEAEASMILLALGPLKGSSGVTAPDLLRSGLADAMREAVVAVEETRVAVGIETSLTASDVIMEAEAMEVIAMDSTMEVSASIAETKVVVDSKIQSIASIDLPEVERSGVSKTDTPLQVSGDVTEPQAASMASEQATDVGTEITAVESSMSTMMEIRETSAAEATAAAEATDELEAEGDQKAMVAIGAVPVLEAIAALEVGAESGMEALVVMEAPAVVEITATEAIKAMEAITIEAKSEAEATAAAKVSAPEAKLTAAAKAAAPDAAAVEENVALEATVTVETTIAAEARESFEVLPTAEASVTATAAVETTVAVAMETRTVEPATVAAEETETLPTALPTIAAPAGAVGIPTGAEGSTQVVLPSRVLLTEPPSVSTGQAEVSSLLTIEKQVDEAAEVHVQVQPCEDEAQVDLSSAGTFKESAKEIQQSPEALENVHRSDGTSQASVLELLQSSSMTPTSGYFDAEGTQKDHTNGSKSDAKLSSLTETEKEVQTDPNNAAPSATVKDLAQNTENLSTFQTPLTGVQAWAAAALVVALAAGFTVTGILRDGAYISDSSMTSLKGSSMSLKPSLDVEDRVFPTDVLASSPSPSKGSGSERSEGLVIADATSKALDLELSPIAGALSPDVTKSASVEGGNLQQSETTVTGVKPITSQSSPLPPTITNSLSAEIGVLQRSKAPTAVETPVPKPSTSQSKSQGSEIANSSSAEMGTLPPSKAVTGIEIPVEPRTPLSRALGSGITNTAREPVEDLPPQEMATTASAASNIAAATEETEAGVLPASLAAIATGVAIARRQTQSSSLKLEVSKDDPAGMYAPEVKGLQLVAACSSIPHPLKASKGGEDASVICRDKHGNARAIGVADGVSGWAAEGIDPAEYSNTLVQKLQEGLSLLKYSRDVRRILQYAQEATLVEGSATLCFAVLHDGGTMTLANIGDSALKVVRKGQVVFSTSFQQHEFNTPYQLSHPQLHELTDKAENAEVCEVQLEEGDILVLASDGLWDNLFDEDIARRVEQGSEPLRKRGADNAAKIAIAEAISESLAQAAHKTASDSSSRTPWALTYTKAMGGGPLEEMKARGGKVDDVTVLVAIATK